MGNDDLVDILCLPFWTAFCGKQTYFRVGSRPVSHAPEKRVGGAIELDPYESDGLKVKAPCSHDIPRFKEQRECDP